MSLDHLLYGFKVTVIGTAIVFVVLYMLQLVMESMRLVFYRPPTQQSAVIGEKEEQ